MTPELLMNPEIVAYAPWVLGLLSSALLLTQEKYLSTHERDIWGCMFALIEKHSCDEHDGDITVHHIHGKKDDADNLITVCGTAHDMIHNGASKRQKRIWARKLKKIAKANGKRERANGWEFPEE